MKDKWTLLLVATLGLLTLSASGLDTVQIDPEIHHQVFDGFGEGTMDQFTPYYYTDYPSSSLVDYLNKLYTLDNNGLGLTICRVLMPVGDAPGHTHMGRFYGQNGLCPPSFEPEDGVFTWNHPKHNEILWKIRGAAARGAKMWANWYSVPYWMTLSGCTAGQTDGGSNLRPDMEGRFAEHVCKVLEHFRDAWNVEFDYLNLINEPEADWWKSGGGQPGCYVSADQEIRILENLKTQLPQYGLSPKQVAYDAAYTNSTGYLNTLLGSTIVNDLDVLSCHQYITSDAAMKQWAFLTAKYNKHLWQTEWGDWTNAQYPGKTPGGDPVAQMKNYADKIHESLAVLDASGWVMWEPEFIFDTQTKNFIPRKAYWAIAQYSRHVRPGMQRVHSVDSAADLKTTVWVQTDAADNGPALVMVTYNSGAAARQVAYDLAAFRSVDITEIRQTSPSQNYQKLNLSAEAADRFELTLPGQSVTTLIGRIRACEPLKADLVTDCIVDIADLVQLSEAWLSAWPLSDYLPAETVVNLNDLAIMAEEWDRFAAFAPLPKDGQNGVHPSTLLYWGDNRYADAYDVYLGTDAQTVLTAQVGSAAYSGRTTLGRFRADLQPNQTYYWRVDGAAESGAVSKGPIWTFTTGEAVPEAALAGHWKFDEIAGSTAADSSLYNHNGTLTGNSTFQPQQGRFGGAIRLDGSGDAVDVGGFSMTTDTATFIAWLNGRRAADWAGIVYSRAPGGSPACGTHFGSSRSLRYTWNDNDAATWGWDSGLTIPDDEWAMTALVIQPDKATLYVASAQAGLRSAVNPLPNRTQTLNNLKIGWDSIGARYFQGLIDDVRIYSRALLPEEIAALAGVLL